MPSRSHSRGCIAAALCLLFFFLLLKTHYSVAAELFGHSGATNGETIYNATLGFETILAINAAWRTDRKDSLTLASIHSGISLEWIHGVNASDIDARVYPQGNHRSLPKGNLGSWRAHMDAIRAVIEGNFSTALIVEDDVDWDPRVRSQLASFGVASRRLPEMIAHAEKAAQDHVPSGNNGADRAAHSDPVELARLRTMSLPAALSAQSSDYGSDWDILWLGHCSTSMPTHQNTSMSNTPPDRFALPDDATVPDEGPAHSSQPSPYPTRTRIYHRTDNTLCTLAYAVTQHGARKIMYEHGIRNFDRGYDFALSEWCDGVTKNMGDRPLCLTSSPPIFGHFQGGGGGARSDIAGVGRNGVQRGSLVKSVRESLEEMVEGDDL